MANQGHLDILKKGVEVWNQWRKEHTYIEADLSGAELSNAKLQGANLEKANLERANLNGATLNGATLEDANLNSATLKGVNLNSATLDGADLQETNISKGCLSYSELEGADLSRAKLSRAILNNAFLSWASLTGANLSGANLSNAYLSKSDLTEATLSGSNLKGATLTEANLSKADLSYANLEGAHLHKADLSWTRLYRANLSNAELWEVNLYAANLKGAKLGWANLSGTNLTGANLTGCYIYAISAWDVKLENTNQSNLIITPPSKPTITVDNLEVAQFIYLLLNSGKIRDVIDTITSKVVLILGRFTQERKVILDAIRDELRKQNYSPVLFDFEKPMSRDFTETVRTLAHLAGFIIADLTEPSSIPQELQAIVPDLEVPVLPLLLETKREYSMFVDFRKYDWVLPVYLYKDRESLIASLRDEIIEPADKKARELAVQKAKRFEKS